MRPIWLGTTRPTHRKTKIGLQNAKSNQRDRYDLLAGLVDESGGHHILYAGSGVAAGDSHEQLQAVGHHSNGGGRDQGQQGEHSLPGPAHQGRPVYIICF